jgi:hypothetical protein
MSKPKPIYTDRDYLEARFSSTDEKLDRILEVIEQQGERITILEKDIGGAKLLGRTALGVTACIGAIASWALDFAGKAATLIPHR